MKVLFIGGTGIISSACSELAISRGMDLYHLNRGKSSGIRKIEGAKTIIADMRNPEKTQKALEGHHFDTVVDWIAYDAPQVQNSIALFREKTDQFVFISSASCYQTPPEKLPVTEDTILDNPFWQYSRDKIACENMLREEGQKTGFPYTIIRPSHTYDKTSIPIIGGYTALHRMKNGLPVVVHGDGTSIWTLTHHKDFAVGLVGLLGKPEAIHDVFHITSDEWLPWNQIYKLFAKALGVTPKLVHVPSHVIATYDQRTGDSLLGDKTHSMIFDNSKIKSMVPDFNAKISFRQGVKEIVAWHEKNDTDHKYDERVNGFLERIIEDYT